jgi:branched-chain amino acid transport system permease protein
MGIGGGRGTIGGVSGGALTITWLNLEGLDRIGGWINDVLGGFGVDSTIDVPKYKFAIFGSMLVLMMLFRPEGLIPSARRKAEFEEGGEESVLYDVRHDA